MVVSGSRKKSVVASQALATLSKNLLDPAHISDFELKIQISLIILDLY